jgi:FG-GAP repeat protein
MRRLLLASFMMAWSFAVSAGGSAEAASSLSPTGPKSDFNGDGFADLAIGAPLDDVGAATDAGVVNVIYGSPGGLSAPGNQLWTQDSPGIGDHAEAGDSLGTSLMTGDFNGDGFADLNSAATGEEVGTVMDAGAANVIYGSASGLTAAGNQVWSQDSPNVEDRSERGDAFGLYLTASDFDGDGFEDLAVGVPFEDLGSLPDAGAANVLYGSAGGVSAVGDQLWTQDSPGIGDMAEVADAFGFSLASGDLDGDGFGDLAVGAPAEDFGPTFDVGIMHVLYGSGSGLSSAGSQVWSQDSPGIRDVAEEGDLFGFYPGIGDFNGDGFADLAVGAYPEDIGAVVDAGGMNAIYGSAAGLTSAGNQFWNQNSAGIRDTSEEDDEFGCWVGPADFDGDGTVDVAICAQTEDVGATDDGAVNVIYGSGAGLASPGNQLWAQDAPGIRDVGENGDFFGWITS